jgi:HTH-type transcriptional regulator / antitoxin HigA
VLAQVIIIENDDDYRAARERLESLMDAEEPEEVALLRAQAMLVAAWEEQQAPAVPPDPIEAIRFRMGQMALAPRDLAATLGTRSRVSEVLGGKRPLTLPMIRRLHRDLGIPADVLIRDPVPHRPAGVAADEDDASDVHEGAA